MIFLRISSHNETSIDQIAQLLLSHSLVIDVNIKRKVERLIHSDGDFFREEVALMTSKTRSILFNRIDKLIREHFPDETLEIYSLPIIHMDWEDARHLKEEIAEPEEE